MTLREMLQEKVLIVTFKKKDGSLREMQCTLISDFLPETKGSGGYSGIVTVYDTEQEGWRSFREDSVIQVTDLEGNLLPLETK